MADDWTNGTDLTQSHIPKASGASTPRHPSTNADHLHETPEMSDEREENRSPPSPEPDGLDNLFEELQSSHSEDPPPTPTSDEVRQGMRDDRILAPDTIYTFNNRDYRIVGVLGRGRQASVYEAVDTHLKRRVAIKLFPKEDASWTSLSRLLDEIALLAEVTSEHVVKILDYDVVHHSEYAVLIMEYLDGNSIEEELQHRTPARIPWRESLRFVLQILDGLEDMHKKGNIHRDLKPSNMFLTKSKTAKLIDLGLALRLPEWRNSTQEMTAQGTPLYMPFEALYSGIMDERADIYSVGASLFHMLTGTPPFADVQTIPQLIAALSDRKLAEELPAELEIPESCRAIIDKATAKKPEDRYQSATEIRQAVQRALDGPRTPLSQNRRTILLGLVLTCLCGLVWWFFLREDSTTPPKNEPHAGRYEITLKMYTQRVGEDENTPGKLVGLPGTLPLRPDERVAIVATASKAVSAYFFVIWIDSTGKASLYHPDGWEADRVPPQEKTETTLRLPEDGGAGPLAASPTGHEGVLVFVRDKKLTAKDNAAIQKLLARLKANWERPKESGKQMWWLDNGILSKDKDLGPMKKELARIGKGPVQQIQALALAMKNQKLSKYNYAIVYPFHNPKQSD